MSRAKRLGQDLLNFNVRYASPTHTPRQCCLASRVCWSDKNQVEGNRTWKWKMSFHRKARVFSLCPSTMSRAFSTAPAHHQHKGPNSVIHKIYNVMKHNRGFLQTAYTCSTCNITGKQQDFVQHTHTHACTRARELNHPKIDLCLQICNARI